MISFQKWSKRYSLGNNLFHYVFVRDTAKRLKVKFYIPHCTLDDIFLLNDKKERAKEPKGITKFWMASKDDKNFYKDSLKIEDGTDIFGYFQTEKYFNEKKVRKWFRFKKGVIGGVKKKYNNIDFSNSVGIHIRFSDTKYEAPFYRPHIRYYVEALSKVKHKKNILIFSDEIKLAKKYFKNLKGNIIYMEENKSFEDLYLMNKCHDFISSASTLSWWGAWLNPRKNKIIIVPKEGPLRPGYKRVKRYYYWPKDWIKIKALRRGILDNYHLLYIKYFPRNFIHKCIKGFKKIVLGMEVPRDFEKYDKG